MSMRRNPQTSFLREGTAMRGSKDIVSTAARRSTAFLPCTPSTRQLQMLPISFLAWVSSLPYFQMTCPEVLPLGLPPPPKTRWPKQAAEVSRRETRRSSTRKVELDLSCVNVRICQTQKRLLYDWVSSTYLLVVLRKSSTNVMNRPRCISTGRACFSYILIFKPCITSAAGDCFKFLE